MYIVLNVREDYSLQGFDNLILKKKFFGFNKESQSCKFYIIHRVFILRSYYRDDYSRTMEPIAADKVRCSLPVRVCRPLISQRISTSIKTIWPVSGKSDHF